MVTRRSMVAAAGAAVVGLVMATSAYSWSSVNRTMYLSFSGPVALPGVTLPAGTYTFERIADDVQVVRVSSQDRKTMYLTTFTQLIDRPSSLADTQHVMLGEARRGMAPPIKAWFPTGERQGHEFIYSER